LALVPFTMQMIMVIAGGNLVASTLAVRSLIQRLARVPRNSRNAVAWIALFSMLTSPACAHMPPALQHPR
jgi:short-chain fatty acids transporter